tara:strand:- start:3264 stop:3521 length:258 start_codon:yes stop_codon:yes gene_type:complete
MAPGQQQDHWHTMTPGSQAQAAGGGKVDILYFGNHEADRRGSHRLLQGPERVREFTRLGMQDRLSIAGQGRQPGFKKSPMLAPER